MPPQFAIREDRMPLTTASWTKWAEEREVDEWLQSMGGVLSGGFNEQ
jgi:actin-like protein 6B